MTRDPALGWLREEERNSWQTGEVVLKTDGDPFFIDAKSNSLGVCPTT